LIQTYLDNGALVALSTEKSTDENQERHIAWKISNKGKARERLSVLLNKVSW
jgi:hypothetical protein